MYRNKKFSFFMNVNGFFICFLNHFLYVLLKISLKNFPKFTLNKLKVLKSNVNFLPIT